jgi:hypothetical protein
MGGATFRDPPVAQRFWHRRNQLGFNVAGYPNQVVVVEDSTNLSNWLPLMTNTLGLAPFSFNDPKWMSFPERFYRARLQ